jgi:hypothetical protein
MKVKKHCPCLKLVVANIIVKIFYGESPSDGQNSFENNVSNPWCDI